MKPKILLTGKNGQIGKDLEGFLAESSELLALGRKELDLSRSQNIRQAVRDFRPHLIVNAAAYTSVDQAEGDNATAFIVNAQAPTLLAEEARRIGAALIHYSTDYVFDGRKSSPYTEDDSPNPINVYGKTKLAGERGIEGAGGFYLILRTAWVYSTRGRNFLLKILRLAAERDELRVVADQVGAPTSSHVIALATTKIITREWNRCQGVLPFSNWRGIYHMTAAGECSWWQFAKAIVEEVHLSSHCPAWLHAVTDGRPLVVNRISPIATAEYPTPARRPAYSVLSNLRLKQTFELEIPDWRAQLRRLIAG